MRVHLFGDGENPRVRKGLDELTPWIESRADLVGVCDSSDASVAVDGTDLAVILGGDGAILATAARLAGAPVPLIGIRLGHFGFLAELEPSTCREHLERIFAGQGRVVERLMLGAELRTDGATEVVDVAVNDAVVTANQPGRLVSLDLDVDGERVATYRGDGLIVSTPLGSTAHSLAAGGPVVEPDSRAILVTPLAAHSLTSRPLVLDAERTITIRLSERRREERAALGMDGQRTYDLDAGQEVVVRRTANALRIMTIVERSYFETLRRKFHWSGSVPLEPPDPDA